MLVRVPSMGQIELFDHLTLCKQVSEIKLNCQCFIAILETLYRYGKNGIIGITKQYLEPFNCLQTNN